MIKYFHLSSLTSCHKSLIHECVTGQQSVTETDMEQTRREGNEMSKKKKITWNWLRNCNTIEFSGIWEQLNNSDFKPVEFDGIRMQAGMNSFALDGYELKTLDGFLKGLGYSI